MSNVDTFSCFLLADRLYMRVEEHVLWGKLGVALRDSSVVVRQGSPGAGESLTVGTSEDSAGTTYPG